MPDKYFQDETFDKIDFAQQPLQKGSYDNCTFINCNFAEADLSGFQFIDGMFKGSNLNMMKLGQTTIRDVKFVDCKMLGIRWDTCPEFGLSFSFDNCQLNHSTFFKTKIKKTHFSNSQLQETDFTEADLSQAIFSHCDLLNATFENSILEKTDFRTAYNFSIDPAINKVRKARFSMAGLPGLLNKFNIDIEP